MGVSVLPYTHMNTDSKHHKIYRSSFIFIFLKADTRGNHHSLRVLGNQQTPLILTTAFWSMTLILDKEDEI